MSKEQNTYNLQSQQLNIAVVSVSVILAILLIINKNKINETIKFFERWN